MYTASDVWCARSPQRVWAPVLLVLSLATSTISALPPAALADVVNQKLIEDRESGEDEQCLLQTRTEVIFRSKKKPSSTLSASQGAMEETDDMQNDKLMEMTDSPYDFEDSQDDVHESQALLTAEENPADVHESKAESGSTGFSLLGMTSIRKSHVLGGLIQLAANESTTDSGTEVIFTIVIIGVVLAVAGIMVACFSMESPKDEYEEPLKRAAASRRSLRPPPPPPPQQVSALSTSEERTTHHGDRLSSRGARDIVQREVRGAVSMASSSQSAMTSAPGTSSVRQSLIKNEARPIQAPEPLCPSMIPHAETYYLLPDLGHMRRPVESFDIVDRSGSSVLGVVVNDGSEDPGILLHAPRTADGSGLPLSFVGTSMALCNAGSLPIARPCADKKHGEFFANLNRDLQGGSYSVRNDGTSFMRFEGDFVGRCIWLYEKGSNQAIGSTQPVKEAYGQIPRFELHLKARKDAALAILSLLAICRMESARPTVTSQGARPSVNADPGVGGGHEGPLFSLGGLQAIT